MSVIRQEELTKVIDIQHFSICQIDNKTLKEICKLYTFEEIGKKSGCYVIDKFIYHIVKQFNIGLIEYCEKYLQIEWPLCPLTGKKVNYKIRNKNYIAINNFHKTAKQTKKNSEKFRNFCDRLSKERAGSGNPMHGKAAWNKGLNLEDPRIEAMAEKRRGQITSDESKKKQSESAKKRKIHGHTGIKHSEETKEKLREHTAKLWASGVFNRITSIHLKVREFLSSLDLKESFKEEFQVKYFSMDFAFPSAKIAIEAQGTYYHIDPRIYPNGPKDAIQRRNFGRDKAKKKVCCDQMGWIIIEVWETEINDGSFKEYLLCRLKELNLLKN